MSKKKKQKGKKGDEELEAEMRMNLQLDIDTLENNIYLEKRREIEKLRYTKERKILGLNDENFHVEEVEEDSDDDYNDDYY